MKIFTIVICTILLTLTYGGVSSVRADCGDDTKSADDGEVKAWFKNLGCQIKKGAEDLQESAKPWADKIAAGAKDFGHTVAQKYDEVKHKLTSDDKPSIDEGVVGTAAHTGSTEKVPLAPLPVPTEKIALAPLPQADTITSSISSGSTHSTEAHGSHDSTATTQK